MTHSFTHQHLLRNIIGADHLADWLTQFGNSTNDTFPPYNTIKTGENEFLVEIAVAGFSKDELTVMVEGPIMKITGKPEKGDDESRTYLHRGIARRGFERVFRLGERVKVASTRLRDGMLEIELRREIPEELRPVRIAIEAA